MAFVLRGQLKRLYNFTEGKEFHLDPFIIVSFVSSVKQRYPFTFESFDWSSTIFSHLILVVSYSYVITTAVLRQLWWNYAVTLWKLVVLSCSTNTVHTLNTVILIEFKILKYSSTAVLTQQLGLYDIYILIQRSLKAYAEWKCMYVTDV